MYATIFFVGVALYGELDRQHLLDPLKEGYWILRQWIHEYKEKKKNDTKTES
jgi:hypothetical protein